MTYAVSPYLECGGLCYFPRMLSKIRLVQASELPEHYIRRCYDLWLAEFLEIDYEALVRYVRDADPSDEQALAWCYQHGREPNAMQIRTWNAFASKRGWNDERSEGLQAKLREEGLDGRGIQTNFDHIQAKEGRL